jgi:hypothetical protein
MSSDGVEGAREAMAEFEILAVGTLTQLLT